MSESVPSIGRLVTWLHVSTGLPLFVSACDASASWESNYQLRAVRFFCVQAALMIDILDMSLAVTD